MRRTTVGIIDYGAGNLAGVAHSLRVVGCRPYVASAPEDLDERDVLMLPGVGAFGGAMASLARSGLDVYLREAAGAGKPIVGICLGMQLLASHSTEGGRTRGLEIIPGEIRRLPGRRWHIGWDTLRVAPGADWLTSEDGSTVFFNNAYAYGASCESTVAVARLEGGHDMPAVIRNGNVVGLQFHPEKSQASGRRILARVISELHGVRP